MARSSSYCGHPWVASEMRRSWAEYLGSGDRFRNWMRAINGAPGASDSR
jgi:hypothetical protein